MTINFTGMEFEENNLEIDPYLDSRLRSSEPITFLGFIDKLIQLWELAGKKGRIIRHSPFAEDSEFPLITYRLLKRVINPSFKDIKPRYRTTIRHPYIKDELVQLMGQIFDCYIEFNIFAQSAEEADQLVEELDDFILMYKGFFKEKGVQEILFLQQNQDMMMTDWKFPIAYRPIQYIMRFEKITPIFLNQIETIAAQAIKVVFTKEIKE